MLTKKFLLFMFVCAFLQTNAHGNEAYDNALSAAIKKGNVEKAKAMFDKGGSFNSVTINGYTPINSIQFLIDNGFLKQNKDCFFYGIIREKATEILFKKVKLLVDAGADIHCHKDSRSLKNSTLIYELIDMMGDNYSKYRVQAIEYILKHGAKDDLNTYAEKSSFSLSGELRSKRRIKPIYQTAGGFFTNKALFNLLIEYGTALNEPIYVEENLYPIHWVIRKFGSEKLAIDMVNKGADVNVITADGWSVIDLAKKRKLFDLEVFLLEKGAKYKHYYQYKELEEG